MHPLQARCEPEEAAREVRALLDLMRESETRMQEMAAPCARVLELASKQLTIVNPEIGEEELIQAMAAALANLRMPQARRAGWCHSAHGERVPAVANGRRGGKGVGGVTIREVDDLHLRTNLTNHVPLAAA